MVVVGLAATFAALVPHPLHKSSFATPLAHPELLLFPNRPLLLPPRKYLADDFLLSFPTPNGTDPTDSSLAMSSRKLRSADLSHSCATATPFPSTLSKIPWRSTSLTRSSQGGGQSGGSPRSRSVRARCTSIRSLLRMRVMGVLRMLEYWVDALLGSQGGAN